MTEPSEIVNGVPVFRPSMEEFHDFYKYMTSINQYGMRSGIVKVVPPVEWTEKLPKPTREQLMSIKIRNPISQCISGQGGVFAQQNIEKARSYNIVQWKALSQEPQYQPPAPRGKNRRSIDADAMKMHRYTLTNKALKDPSVFDDFDYNIDTSEFTAERCEQLEKIYWKSLLYTEPLYGADMIGSIFDDSVKEWNVAHLPNVLDHMEEKLPGVNEAYLYAGLWKATFSWHLEDQDLYSINYIHFGAPKQWYSIPQKDKEKFDTVMRETFPTEYDHCPDFLRHKTFLVSPSYLEARGVQVNKIVHNEGEFMITYPFGYHAGMNYGYNVAESVNFALEEWFEYGMKTTKCMCIHDAVGIDLERLMRRFKGEPDVETREPLQEEVAPVVNEASSMEDQKAVPQIESKKELSPKRRIHDDNTPKQLVKKIKLNVTPPVANSETCDEQQCLLCPNSISSQGDFKFNQFSLIPTREFLSGETTKQEYCHKICAEMIHEIKIESFKGIPCLVGLEDVPPARKRLKCVFCHKSKGGACFQCADPRCTRAYHATCAVSAGVYLGENENDTWCKVHRHKAPGEQGQDARMRYLSSIDPGDLIQLKLADYFSGIVISKNHFAGVVVSKNGSEGTVWVYLYPISGERILMEVPESAVQLQGIKIASREKVTSLPTEEKPSVSSVSAKQKSGRTPRPDSKEFKNTRETHAPSNPPYSNASENSSKPETSNPSQKSTNLLKSKELDFFRLKDPRYSNSVDNFFGRPLVLGTLKVTESASVFDGEKLEVWHYKPLKSSDFKARYVDDVLREEPNDPESLKKRVRKSRKKTKPILITPDVSPRPTDRSGGSVEEASSQGSALFSGAESSMTEIPFEPEHFTPPPPPPRQSIPSSYYISIAPKI